MDEAGLWRIIEAVRHEAGGDLEASIDAFRTRLGRLDDAALVAAEAIFSGWMAAAYTWELWGAAYVIHGGCSDDAFWDFRAGLIALGEQIYTEALVDPDGLVAIEDLEELTLFEGFQYVPGALVEARGLARVGPGHSPPTGPTGAPWSEADLPARYPCLTERFG